MFSVPLRLLSTQHSRQFIRRFSFNNSEPPVKPRKTILPIATYDGQGPINGYFIALKDASKKQAVISQLADCEYSIIYEFSETRPCFSGKFDTKALEILRRSPYVKGIAERYAFPTIDIAKTED